MQGKPIQLWLASPHFYPTYGGAQNRYRGYIRGFLERGMDVRIVAGTPQFHERTEADINAGWYGEKPGSWLPTTELDGIPLERIRLPDSDGDDRTEIFYKGLLEVCQRPSEGPIVLQVLTNLRPEALPWLRRLKKSGVVLLCSVSQYPKWPNKKSKFKRFHRRLGYRRVYNEFDALVTNSEPIEAFLRQIGVKTHIECIPNGVNLQRFHPVLSDDDKKEVAALRQRLGIPSHHRVIVTVGAVMPRKGQNKLVKAWCELLSRHPDISLLIVGPRADIHNPKFVDFGEEIADLVAKSGAAEQVHFTGPVDDVAAWLRASDLFVLASDREGTPNSVLEAMATGLPCVVTPFTGISSGIGEAGKHYQLAERRPLDIAIAISALLESEACGAEQGERGRQFVIEKADQSRSLDLYARLYSDACNNRRDRLSMGDYVWR